jgi:hypothetical protein
LDWLLDNPETVSDPAHSALHMKGPRLEDLNPPEFSGPAADAPPLAPVDRERPRAAKHQNVRTPASASQPRANHPASPQQASKTAPISQPPTEPARSGRPSVLLHPRSAERLSLSAEQHSRLREMIDDAGEAVDQAVRARLSAVSHSPPVTKAEHTADRIIEMFTAEQREAATKLLGEGGASPPAQDGPAGTNDVPR